jgi:hypothetical protein
MRVVLARVLERTDLRATQPELAKAQLRAITLSPKGGVPVLQERAPLGPGRSEACESAVLALGGKCATQLRRATDD